MRLSLRANDDCGGITKCPQPKHAECQQCGAVHGPYPSRPAPCPECGSQRYQKQRCADCPVLALDEMVAASPRTPLYQSAVRIDTAIKSGIQIRMEDFTEIEFRALLLLGEEVAAWQLEKAKRDEESRRK